MSDIVIRQGGGSPTRIRAGFGSPITITRKLPAAAASIVTDQLLVHLDAANASSYPGTGTTWSDLSGNGYTGTLTNGPTYSSNDGGVIQFDGVDDTVNIEGLDLRKDFSLELWVKFNYLQNRNENLFGQGSPSNGPNKALGILQSDTYALVYYMYYNDFTLNPTSTTISNNTWYQYVFTYSNSSPYTKSIYRNGQLIGQSTSGQSVYEGTGTFRIGDVYSSGTDSPLNGSVGIMRAYSKVLSDAEVLQNYDANKSRYNLPTSIITDGLLVHLDAGNVSSYPGTGTTWSDLSGNNNNGTLTNGPTFDSGNSGSIVFDGSNDYVTLGNLGTIGNFQTIDVWFYSTSVTNYKNLLDMNYANYGATGNVGPRFEQSSGGASGWGWSGNTTSNDFANFQSTSYSISANTWYNVTWVNDNGTVAVYLNGSARQTGISSPNGFITTYGAANIGRGFHLDASRYFAGKVPLVKIYNRALSASEVLQNYNAVKFRYLS